MQTSNRGTVLDADGDYSDWVELVNRGATTADLAGWSLSDRSSDPRKWTFPARLLTPGARLLVFASGKDRTNAVAAAALSSPLDLPGLVLWLKADAESRTNGERVAAWTDLSGFGNHAFTTNGAACPTYRTNAVNGRASMRFARAAQQQFLLPTATFNGLSSLRDVTVMVVCRWGGSASSGLLGAWDSAAGNTHFEINSGGQVRLRVGALDSVRSNGVMTAGAWCQIAGAVNSAGDSPAASVYRDGALRGTFARDPGAAALSGYQFFALGNALKAERFFDGDMAEVLIFNRSLPALERQSVERYLADRYKLPLTNGVEEAELHANFSLDAGGEEVVLTRSDASTADAVAVPDVPADASYGRSPDGAGAFAYFAQPTPGAANATSPYGAPLAKPDVSRKRGLCEAPFALALSHEDPLASIYYTADGSEPSHTNGLLYAGPLDISTTVVIRAAAYRPGALPVRAIATHSYLFPEGVLGQTSTPQGYPTAWGGFTNVSYGVSPFVAAQAGFTNAMLGALKAVPILSLSLSRENMFGTNGVYANPLVDGFERVASAEWLTNGASYTQADAALRVQGAASRDFANTPKKSLRLLFREEYGDARLKKPVLSAGGTQLADFNTLVLRADYNNSWVHWDAAQRLRGISAHDQWVRNSQIAMGGAGSHGSFVQLFVNGLYWGLYNVSERTDAAFAASYFGGASEDYDAMTQDGIRDGDNVAWNALVAAARGDLTVPAQYESLKQLLDVPQFIDYMVVNLYGSNEDWPVNNWCALRQRAPGAGFKFFCWDVERTLEVANANKTGVSGTLTNAPNPASFYTALRASAEFRLQFADRLHRHLFNGGALTPSNAVARFAALTSTVETAVFGESARWGAYRCEIYDRGGPSPRYGLSHFTNECARLIQSYFPVRTGIVLGQFKAAGLYPSLAAPEFSQHGGALAYGASLALTGTTGVVYVTLDGSDPRVAYTGTVSASAFRYAGPFAVTNAGLIRARALTNGVWSALTEASFGVALSEPRFLPAGDADWAVATNWSGAVVPGGPGAHAVIGAPDADRNVNVRAPLTVGRIAFDHAGSACRNRVRDRGAGNALTFDGGAAPACVAVTGDGPGYAEFDVAAGVVLQTDLLLDVQNVVGDPDYGALRLRGDWSGPGGLIKRGAGAASLTGETKGFAGPVAVEEGVLSVSGPAAPASAASVAVSPGGQLRLTSSSSPGEPRTVVFGGALTLSGAGRVAGQGRLGALRYEPGTASNVCVLTAPIALQGEASVHVEGSQNRLELTGVVGGGSRLVKSGGGALTLPSGSVLTAAVDVANGCVAFGGPASVGALTGAGAVRVDGYAVRASSLGGVAVEAVLRVAGAGACSNGLVAAARVEAPPSALRIYLPAEGDVFRGALAAPLGAGLEGAVRAATREVYVPDAAGSHAFDGGWWRLLDNAQVVTVPAQVGAETLRVVEVRIGGAPASYAAWRATMFTSAVDRASEAVSGPLAAPVGDGLPNLTRYALGLGWSASGSAGRPRLELEPSGATYRLPFDPGRDDIAVIVDASSLLCDWSAPELLFDSRIDDLTAWRDGWLALREGQRPSGRFYRLRIILLDGE